jgi:DNA-binding response OmpR family regulator
LGRRILAVEDDPDVLGLITQQLQAAGLEVWRALSAEAAACLIEERGLPHLAVVDIMLPGMDGLTFCRKLHDWSDLPVVMLTSVDEEETVVEAIREVAEDYIVKPFKPRELVARVERVLRRIGDFSYRLDPVIAVDSRLAIDFARQRVLVDEQPVALTAMETKLLHILMRGSGRTVPTEFLLRRLWPSEDVFEDTLRVHIHRLRAKIEANPSKPRYVVTERGLGYRFPAGL